MGIGNLIELIGEGAERHIGHNCRDFSVIKTGHSVRVMDFASIDENRGREFQCGICFRCGRVSRTTGQIHVFVQADYFADCRV